VKRAAHHFGKLDIVVNNAGYGHFGMIEELTEDEVRAQLETNLFGALWVTQAALPIMRAQGEGVIITISSLAAWEQYPYVTYKATKAAMIAFTQQVAIQNAEFGIRANVILPGLMNTPMAIESRVAAGTPREEVIAARDRRVPLGRRMGTGWDVAYAALYLHSDEAAFVTGVSLAVDGGESVCWGS